MFSKTIGGLRPRFLRHARGADVSSPMYVYRWEVMQELIERFKDWDGDPHEAISIEYVDPLTGGPVFKTMTFFVQVLRPGERTLPVRQTASLLVAPFEGGGGHSIVDGKRFDWNQFDNLAIPKDAKNVAEAHAFINYLQTPEVAARNSNFISYANGNLASQQFIDKAVLDDRTIYPDETVMSRLFTIRAYDPATQRVLNRLWTRVKTGR